MGSYMADGLVEGSAEPKIDNFGINNGGSIHYNQSGFKIMGCKIDRPP